jgi:hypothetical protein
MKGFCHVSFFASLPPAGAKKQKRKEVLFFSLPRRERPGLEKNNSKQLEQKPVIGMPPPFRSNGLSF